MRSSYVAAPGLLSFFRLTSGLRHWLNYAAPSGTIASERRNKTGMRLDVPYVCALHSPGETYSISIVSFGVYCPSRYSDASTCTREY